MKIKVLKARNIVTNNISFTDIYILNCLGEEMVEKHFEKNKPLKCMDGDKTIMYINPSNIICYVLYDEMVEIEL